RLLAGDRHQHFLLPARCLARFLGRLLRHLRLGCHTPDAPPQRLHEVDDILAARPLLRHDRFASTLLIDEINQRRFVLVLELLGLEVTRLLVHDVLGEIEHVLGDFDVLDLVKIFVLGTDFIGIAQQRADQPLAQRFEGDNVLAAGEHYAPNRDHVHVADGLADDSESVVAHLAIGTQVIGPDDVPWIDLVALHELVDLNRARRLQRDILELLARHLHIGVGIDLVSLDDIVAGNLFTGVRIYLQVFDAVAGVLIDLVEADLVGRRRGWIERYWASHERKPQKTFQFARGAMDADTPDMRAMEATDSRR